MKPSVGVVLLNYMSYDLTIKCIGMLKEQIYDNLKIIVVDNASKNDSVAVLQEYCKKENIFFYQSCINGGYAKGNNIGIKEALKLEVEYILIMNNDVIFPRTSWLEELVGYLEKRPAIGLLGPGIYTNGNRDPILMVSKPKWKQEVFVNFFRIPLWLIGKKRRSIHVADEKKNVVDNVVEKEVYAVSGCCMMFTSKCIQKIGGFDEGTFLYNEELIVGEKCLKNKIPIVYNSRFHVLHEHGATIKQYIQIKQQYKLEEISRMYYYKKFREDVSGWKYWILNISAKFNRMVNVPLIFYFDKKG